MRRKFTAAQRDLGADNPVVRAGAAADLPRHEAGHRDEVIELLSSALQDDHAQVRGAAALALADLSGLEAIHALRKAARDSAPHVRQMALTAIGEIGDKSALPEVKRSLQDESAAVRFQAVIAFPRICQDPETATVALLNATRDDDDLVCHIALRMAEELGHASDVVDPRIADRSLEMLDHDSERVQLASAVILGRIGRLEGREILLDAARGVFRTGELDDEAAAIELCGELQIHDAIDGLAARAFQRRLFHRDPLTWQARVALARMGEARAISWIERELSAWTRERRTLAVAAAGKAKLASLKAKLEDMRDKPHLADSFAVAEALANLEASDEPVEH